MNDLTLDRPRRCPTCERLVPGARCPLDDAVTEPDGDLGSDDPLVGTEPVEGFRIQHRVPSCGGGVAYEIVQEGGVRRGILRLLDLTEEESYGVADRFAKVYSNLFSVHHPSLPPVLRYGRTPDGRLYVVTGVPEGESLEALLRRGRPLSVARSIAIVLRVADALAALHAAGLVHGDVGPSRVWVVGVDDALEGVTLTDSGLFEVMAARRQVSPPAEGGRLFCDARTLPPEVAAGYSADARADLYALGVLLHMLVTGAAPFSGSNRAELLRKHLREPFPAGSLVGLPGDLKRVIVRLCEKSPNDRFQTADELKTALQNTLDLIEMIGHDTDPDLTALASAPSGSPTPWGEMVTIGDDDGPGGAGPVLASPSVLLREPSAQASRAEARRHSSVLPVLAATLIFLVVAGLVAVRFLTLPVDPHANEPETLAALEQAPAPRVEPPAKSKPASAMITASVEPAVAVPKPIASTPTSPVPAPEAPKVVQMTDGSTHSGQPIAIEVRSDPRGAFVLRDGFKIGETPLTISLQSRKPFLVSLEKPGFMTNVVEILPEHQTRYDVRLAPGDAPAVVATPSPAPSTTTVAKPKVRPAEPKKGVEAKKPPEPKKPAAPAGYDLF